MELLRLNGGRGLIPILMIIGGFLLWVFSIIKAIKEARGEGDAETDTD